MSNDTPFAPLTKSRRDTTQPITGEGKSHGRNVPGSTLSDNYTLILPPLAHWSDRGLAAIIDFLLFLTPSAIGILLAAGVSPISTTAARSVAVVGVIASFIILFLSWLQEGGTGQTAGKKMLGIVVVDGYTGQPIGYGQGIRKGLLKIVRDGAPAGLGWIQQARNGQTRKSKADELTNSAVVYSRTNEQQEYFDKEKTPVVTGADAGEGYTDPETPLQSRVTHDEGSPAGFWGEDDDATNVSGDDDSTRKQWGNN